MKLYTDRTLDRVLAGILGAIIGCIVTGYFNSAPAPERGLGDEQRAYQRAFDDGYHNGLTRCYEHEAKQPAELRCLGDEPPVLDMTILGTPNANYWRCPVVLADTEFNK